MPDIGCAVEYDPLLLQKRIDAIHSPYPGHRAPRREQIEAAVRLLDEGATVPFICPLSKEIWRARRRTITTKSGAAARLLRELERRQVILHAIDEQGKFRPRCARR